MPRLKKIVVIGPESTGKSTLCEQLADDFKTQWVPEFARNYLLEIRRPYSYEDLLYVAEGQVELEDRICPCLDESHSIVHLYHLYAHTQRTQIQLLSNDEVRIAPLVQRR